MDPGLDPQFVILDIVLCVCVRTGFRLKLVCFFVFETTPARKLPSPEQSK